MSTQRSPSVCTVMTSPGSRLESVGVCTIPVDSDSSTPGPPTVRAVTSGPTTVVPTSPYGSGDTPYFTRKVVVQCRSNVTL